LVGVQLVVGTLHNTLQESGAAALPIEEELIQAVRESTLLCVDETSWMELGALLWLGRFSARTASRFFWIAYRSAELINNRLGEVYDGWLMSNGYGFSENTQTVYGVGPPLDLARIKGFWTSLADYKL
jgi:transposase